MNSWISCSWTLNPFSKYILHLAINLILINRL